MEKGTPEGVPFEVEMMKMRESYTCPLELAHDAVRGKWKPIILWQLGKGKQQLASLQKSISGISQKMLIQHLKEMEGCGFVGKTAYQGYPLKVEYFLSGRGERALGAIGILQEIGIEMMKEDGRESFLREKGLI